VSGFDQSFLTEETVSARTKIVLARALTFTDRQTYFTPEAL